MGCYCSCCNCATRLSGSDWLRCKARNHCDVRVYLPFVSFPLLVCNEAWVFGDMERVYEAVRACDTRLLCWRFAVCWFSSTWGLCCLVDPMSSPRVCLVREWINPHRRRCWNSLCSSVGCAGGGSNRLSQLCSWCGWRLVFVSVVNCQVSTFRRNTAWGLRAHYTNRALAEPPKRII